jgi:ureidoglycolate hydrolase
MDTDFTLLKPDSKFAEIPCEDATMETLTGVGELFRRRDFSRTITVHCSLTDPVTSRQIIINESSDERIIESMQLYGHIKIKDGKAYKYAVIDPDDPFKFIFKNLEYLPHTSKTLMSHNEDPFIIVLGTELDNLKAFIFNGKDAVRIPPRVWHSPPILHYSGDVQFAIKESATRAKISYDSVKETGHWLYINYG